MDELEVHGRKAETGSDDLPQVLCSPCQADGKNIDAQGYCETCRHYLCDQCYKYHTVAGPMRHHVLVDKSQMPLSQSRIIQSVEAVICTDLCQNHGSKCIEYFCNHHSQLACSVCVTLDHTDCKGKVLYIPEVAKSVNDNDEYKEMIQHLQHMQTSAERMKTRFKQNKKSSKQEGNEAERNMLQLKEDMTGFVDDIVENMQGKFESVRKGNIKRMQEQVDSCNSVITAIENLLRTMERKEKQRAALFVAIKHAKSQVDWFQNQIADLEQDAVFMSYEFIPNERTVALVKDQLTDLGNFKSLTQSSNKGDFTQQLMPDVTAIQRQLKDTLDKVNSRDAIIKQQNADVETLKSRHHQEMVKKNDAIKELEDSIKQCEHELNETRKKAETEASTQSDTTRQQIADMDRLTVMHKEEVAKHKENTNKLEGALEQHKANLQETKKKAETQVNSRDAIIKQQNADVETLKSRHHQEMVKKNDAIKELEDSINQCEHELHETRKKAETEVNSRDAIIKQQNADVETLKSRHHQEMVKKNDAIKELEDSINQCEHELHETRKKAETEASTQSDTIRQQNAEMDRLTAMHKEEVAKHKENTNKLEGALEQHKADLQETKKKAETQVNSRDAIIKQQNADVETLKSRHHQEMVKKNDAIKELEDSINQCEHELHETRKKAETEASTQSYTIRQQNTKMDRLTAMHKEEVAKHKENTNKLEGALEQHKANLQETKKKAETQVNSRDAIIKQQNADVETLKSRHHQEMVKKNDAIKELEDSINQCEHELHETRKKAETEPLSYIRQQNAEMDRLTAMHKEEVAKHKENTNKLEGALEQHKADLQETKKKAETQATIFGKTQQNMQKVSMQNERLNMKIEELQSQLDGQLTDTNTNIADLSDMNPTKLGERYNELYDNQWTEAFEFIKKYKDEKETTKFLKNILFETNQYCVELAKTQMLYLQDRMFFGRTWKSSVTTNHINTILKDGRKVAAAVVTNDLFEKYMSDMRQKTTGYTLTSQELEPFRKECFEICWLMAVQDPPVVLGKDATFLDTFDTNLYKAYTHSGSKVEFLVWPPMYLSKDGAVLTKGVAQGYQLDIKRTQSAAPRRSTSPEAVSTTATKETGPVSKTSFSRSAFDTTGNTRPADSRADLHQANYQQETVYPTSQVQAPPAVQHTPTYTRMPSPDELRSFYYYEEKYGQGKSESYLGRDAYYACVGYLRSKWLWCK